MDHKSIINYEEDTILFYGIINNNETALINHPNSSLELFNKYNLKSLEIK
jgi:hypothetical protein